MEGTLAIGSVGSGESRSLKLLFGFIGAVVLLCFLYFVRDKNEEHDDCSSSSSSSISSEMISSYPEEWAKFNENFSSSLEGFDYLSLSSFVPVYDKMVGEIDHLITETKKEDGATVVYKIVAQYPREITIESKPLRGNLVTTWPGLVLKYGEDYKRVYGSRYPAGEVESWGAQRFVIWDSSNGDNLLIENLEKIGLGRIVPLLGNAKPKIKALILEKILIYTYVFNVGAGGPQYMVQVKSFINLVDLFETGWIIPPKNKIRR